MNTHVANHSARSIALLATLFALAGAVPAQEPAQEPAQGGRSDAPAPRAPGGAPPSPDAVKMGSPPQLQAGLTEPDMWPAATAEGWKKPVLIPWQRSFDDALRVARATQKPILVAVNMDGEIASEHYAGVRYRDPESAKLFEPYVCVVASVYRHTPRDHDEQGRRILCPRLGGVTCGEHIAAETELYEKYFEGVRVSPRHLVLEIDGRKTYDVYYSWDTATVFTTLRKGAENRPPPVELLRDVPFADRTASPDVVDRDAIEQAYLAGGPEVRRTLIQSVLQRRAVDQVDLLRLAVFGLDLELARMARAALTQCETEAAVDLIAEALKAPLPADERAALVEASARLSEKFPRARTLTALHRGLSQGSQWIDARRWSELEYQAGARGGSVRTSGPSLEATAERSEERPEDAGSQLELGAALLARALEPTTDRRFAELLVRDARDALRRAQELGAAGWRFEAAQSVAALLMGEADRARARAVAAVEGGMLTVEAGSDVVLDRAGLRVVASFASARQRAIRQAYRAGSEWPPEWLSDIEAAYALLVKHPFATDEDLVSFHDFLRWLGGTVRANAILDDALARFPGSALVHDRLRARILWESGPKGLESAYAARIAKDPASADLAWFAGYASLVAAEHHRRGAEGEKALGAYERGIAHYEESIRLRAEGRATADHFIALAHAGRARLALEAADLARATSEILASFARAPGAAATPDGLNITPADTAKMLRARLEADEHAGLRAQLQAGMDALDPALLEKRPFELETPRRRPRGQRDD